MADWTIYMDDVRRWTYNSRLGAETAALVFRESGLIKVEIKEAGLRPDPCWVTNEGQVLAYVDFEDRHLINILNMITRGALCPEPATWAALEAEVARRGPLINEPAVRVELQVAAADARRRWPALNEARRSREELSEVDDQHEDIPEERLRAAFGFGPSRRSLPRDADGSPNFRPALRAAARPTQPTRDTSTSTPIRCRSCDEFFKKTAPDQENCPRCRAQLERRAAAQGPAPATSTAPAPESDATFAAFFVCGPCERDHHDGCVKRGATTGLLCTCSHNATDERFRRIEID